MDSFELKTAARSVPIRFAEAGVEWIAAELRAAMRERKPRAHVVTDEHVALHYLERLQFSLAQHGFEVSRTVLTPGEERKTMRSAAEILDAVALKQFARDDVIIGLGGGVVTDIAGFVASVYLRGISWVAAPTTLLGMVDAAIGGKTGVNHSLGKNLIGAFHQPLLVLCALNTLQTLPERELKSGGAELVKSALLAGGGFWEEVQLAGSDARTWSREQLTRFTKLGAEVKIGIVARDEREQGERMLLNLGHTFGHALEQATGYGTLTHGEAVFYGLRAALWLSLYTECMHPKRADELLGWLCQLQLPAAECDPQALIAALDSDKKRAERKLRWVLLREAGQPFVTSEVSEALIDECATWLCGMLRRGVAQPEFSERPRRVLVINGPNLNLLGTREPDVYGTESYEELARLCERTASELDMEIMLRQTNQEGEFVELLHWSRGWADGLILNPGGYTHSSVAIRDALSAIQLPAVEVHLSAPLQREPFRHVSLIGDLCVDTLSGAGIGGYRDALTRLADLFGETPAA